MITPTQLRADVGRALAEAPLGARDENVAQVITGGHIRVPTSRTERDSFRTRSADVFVLTVPARQEPELQRVLANDLRSVIASYVKIERVIPRRDRPVILAATIAAQATPDRRNADRAVLQGRIQHGWNRLGDGVHDRRIGSADGDVDAVVRISELGIIHHGGTDCPGPLGGNAL